MNPLDRAAIEGLAGLLLERAGLKIAADGFHGLRLAMTARMAALGSRDGTEYLGKLRGAAGEDELRALLPLVTVGKTDFFRDGKQMHALKAKVFPDLAQMARAEDRKIQVWSAGCATGEEPYSLAMILDELGIGPQEVDLWATDVNGAALDFARKGCFPMRRMSGVGHDRLQRFFEVTDSGFAVQQRARDYVRFDRQNLADAAFPKVRAGTLDLILCRNVIIYFDLPTIRGLMDRFLEALRPGGYLFLGYSESLFKVYDRFEMVEVEGSFVYRRRKEGAPERPAPLQIASSVKAPPRPERAAGPVARRLVAAPVAPAPPVRPLETPIERRSPLDRLAAAVKQVEQGDFQGGLKAIQAIAAEEGNDLAVLLTLGNVHCLLGQIPQARDAFGQALAREPLCVEARLYGGIAAMQANALEDARAELTRAIFLEPALALGHYLLAQVQERLGELAGARRSYKNVLSQLKLPQRPLAGYYPDLLESGEAISRAARYALAALEERA